MTSKRLLSLVQSTSPASMRSSVSRSVDPVAWTADTDHHTPGLDVGLLADRVGDHTGDLR